MPWGLIIGATIGTGVGLAAGYNNGQRGWDLVGCGLAGGAIGGVAGLVLWDAPVLFAQDAFGFNVYQSIGNGLSTMGQGGAAAASQGASAASQITAGQGIAQGILQTGSFVAQLALNDPGAGGAASQSDFNRWMQDQSMDQMYVDMMRQMREMTFADLTPMGGGMKVVKGAVNPKIYAQLEKQLAQHGPESIKKALSSAEKTLKAHADKLPYMKFKSAVEKTITNVRNQIETIEKFMIDKGIR